MFAFSIKKYYLSVVCMVVVAVVIYTIISSKPINKYLINHLYTDRNTININRISRDMIIRQQDFQGLEENNKSQSIITTHRSIGRNHINYNVHIFYYAWYGNVKTDGKYKHWNHKYLENWKKSDSRKYPTGRHIPPYDIGSNYFPYLGCYSSADIQVINTHLKHISEANIGVIVISWAPPNFTDSPSQILPDLFNAALKYNVKIALHVEPYAGRNPINLQTHLKQFFFEYGNHPALYKIRKPLGEKHKDIPVIYIYDSYLTPAVAWRQLLSTKGNLSVRNTAYDAIYLGLIVDVNHKYHIKKSQFDGFYTYFATNSFTYGSTWKNWKQLSKFAEQNDLTFVPSVGPGYIDVRVRPWNMGNTRHRRHGQYYDAAWRTAIHNKVDFVSITSFNEWHEGTQIEPARPKKWRGFAYLDYEPEGPYHYLNLTSSWISQFEYAQD